MYEPQRVLMPVVGVGGGGLGIAGPIATTTTTGMSALGFAAVAIANRPILFFHCTGP